MARKLAASLDLNYFDSRIYSKDHILYVFTYFTFPHALIRQNLEKVGLYKPFKNSLIIHEENTKKTHKGVVSLQVIEIALNLYKL